MTTSAWVALYFMFAATATVGLMGFAAGKEQMGWAVWWLWMTIMLVGSAILVLQIPDPFGLG